MMIYQLITITTFLQPNFKWLKHMAETCFKEIKFWSDFMWQMWLKVVSKYWLVSVGFTNKTGIRWSFLPTTWASKKLVFSFDYLDVNVIVGWQLLQLLTNSFKFSLPCCQSMKASPIYLHQTISFSFSFFKRWWHKVVSF